VTRSHPVNEETAFTSPDGYKILLVPGSHHVVYQGQVFYPQGKDPAVLKLEGELNKNEAWAAEKIGALTTTIANLEDQLRVISQSRSEDAQHLKDLASKALCKKAKVFDGTKVTLKQEFNLPEDEELLQTAIRAPNTRRAIQEYDEWLRVTLKYGYESSSHWPTKLEFKRHEEPYMPFNSFVSSHIFQRCRDRLWEELRGEDVTKLY
jgi:hypothetical protein